MTAEQLIKLALRVAGVAMTAEQLIKLALRVPMAVRHPNKRTAGHGDADSLAARKQLTAWLRAEGVERGVASVTVRTLGTLKRPVDWLPWVHDMNPAVTVTFFVRFGEPFVVELARVAEQCAGVSLAPAELHALPPLSAP